MGNSADGRLLADIKLGSITAYEKLFNRYYKPLTAQAFYLLGDAMEAEDLVQNLFVYLWQEKVFSQINTSLKHYLSRAVRNRCINVLDQRKVHQRRLARYLRIQDDLIEETKLEEKETEERLEKVLNLLPPQRLEAFSLVYLEDKKYKEAAAQMGLSLNSIKTHLRLAVKALQRSFSHFK